MNRPKRSYDFETKHKTCLYWFIYRSWGRVSRKMKIPVATIRSWAKQPWWEEIQESIRAKYLAKQDAVYTLILDKAGTNILNQLQKGVTRRKPNAKGELIEWQEDVPLRDQITAVKEVTHALALQRGEATSRAGRTDKTKKSLPELSKALEGVGKTEELDPATVRH